MSFSVYDWKIQGEILNQYSVLLHVSGNLQIYNVICPRISMRNDQLVSSLTSVVSGAGEAGFFHLIKSPAYVLVVQFNFTPVHIHKNCSFTVHASAPSNISRAANSEIEIGYFLLA